MFDSNNIGGSLRIKEGMSVMNSELNVTKTELYYLKDRADQV